MNSGFTGIDAGLLRGLNLSAEAAAFVLTGQDIAFEYIKGYLLTGEAGSFALTGQDAALIADRILEAGAGGFTLTGNAATFVKGVVTPVMIADPQWQIMIKAHPHKIRIVAPDHGVLVKAHHHKTTIH